MEEPAKLPPKMTPTPPAAELNEDELGRIERLVKYMIRRRKPQSKEEILALGSLIKSAIGYSISFAISKVGKK